MRHRKKNRHFLLYIGEHLTGMLVLFFIAVVLSIVGRTVGDMQKNPSSTDATKSIAFNVLRLGVVCIDGTTRAKYHFSIDPIRGGYITLTTPQGNDYIDNANGFGIERILGIGTYRWTGIGREGSVASGEFVIEDFCATVNSQAIETSVIAPMSNLISLGTEQIPHLQVRLFIDNKPITDMSKVLDSEQVEVRVTTITSTMVEIIATNALGQIQLIGKAAKDDLLSKPGVDVWSYMWNVSKSPEGAMKLVARVRYVDGKSIDGDQMSITVRHWDGQQKTTFATPRWVATKSEIPESPEEKNVIIARISDPASCGNPLECRIYCKSTSEENIKCQSFVQKIITHEVLNQVSLADDISDERLLQMLTDVKKRPKEIPEIIQEPWAFKQFCSVLAHVPLCTKILLQNDMSAPDTLLAKKEALAQEKEVEHRLFLTRTGARAFIDSDNDGVLDFDEVNIYKTDPNNADTDSDGFQDGAELLAQTNPRGGMVVFEDVNEQIAGGTVSSMKKRIADESVIFENPMITGETDPSILVVKSVEVVEIAQDDMGTTTTKKLKFEGIAPPNSFITLYIFSDPLIVTVKADATGSWTYILNKELPLGTHLVYGAITNTEGHILVKSEPFQFVKTLEAVSFGGSVLPSEKQHTRFPSGASLYALFAVIIGILGIALSVAGFVIKHEGKKELSSISKKMHE